MNRLIFFALIGLVGLASIAIAQTVGVIYINRQTLTATATALPNQQLIRAAAVCAPTTNVATAGVGSSTTVTPTTNGAPLPAGQCINLIPVNNVALLYVITTSSGASANDYVYWIAE